MTLRNEVGRDRALIDAHRLLTDVMGLDDVVVAVRDVVKRTIGASSVSLVWIREDTARLLVEDDVPGGEADPMQRPLVGDVLRGRHEMVIDQTPPREKGRSAVTGGESVVVVPLMRRGLLHGVLEARREAGGEGFENADAELLTELGESIVFVVANAHVQEELIQLSAENRQLWAISMDLGRSLPLSELLRRILEHLGEIVPYEAAGIYLERGDAGDIQWLEHVGYPGDAHEPLHLKLGEGIVGRVAQSGTPARIGDVAFDPDYVSARPDTRSEMVVPIRSSAGDGVVIGAFNVESDRTDAFSERDLERLEVFASLAAVAIDREWARELGEQKARLDRELALARRIQRYFLPRKTPIVPGYDLWGDQRPSIEMSGDYFDVIDVSPGQFGLVVADVSGKGVPAALIMASLRAGLISEVRNVYAIERIIAEVNEFLVDSVEEGAFVTAFYGVLDASSGLFTYVNAGHEPPLLLRPGSGPEWLSTGGTILGAFPGLRYEESRVTLRSGDVLVMYTDGITEARRGEETFFGVERILEVAASTHWKSARALGEAIGKAVRRFTGREEAEDDETLLVVRVP